MSYRKLKIGDDTYEYTIGKKMTKIRGMEPPFLNSVIGNPILTTPAYRSVVGYLVTPANVRDAILKNPVRIFECKEHNVRTTEVTPNPYNQEIYSKTHYMIACLHCYQNSAGDI